MNGFLHKLVQLENRSFSLKIQKFENGYFVSVSEGNDKIGSMNISMATGPTPTTTTIIPSRSESLFLRLLSERISTRIKLRCRNVGKRALSTRVEGSRFFRLRTLV